LHWVIGEAPKKLPAMPPRCVAPRWFSAGCAPGRLTHEAFREVDYK